jgi:phosphatidate cytidylyltransferase
LAGRLSAFGCVAAVLLTDFMPVVALVAVVSGAAAVWALTPGQGRAKLWSGFGPLYAGLPAIALVWLRGDGLIGRETMIWLMLLVWATDIGAYAAGRTIGGPKLLPRVSPKKTWAGALGGLAASLAVAGGFAALGLGAAVPLVALGAILSVVSQLGDLFESAVKRRFGVKDSSHLIPGHGGLMDRLDGFIAAIVVAWIFGFLRHGVHGAGSGLMVW